MFQHISSEEASFGAKDGFNRMISLICETFPLEQLCKLLILSAI